MEAAPGGAGTNCMKKVFPENRFSESIFKRIGLPEKTYFIQLPPGGLLLDGLSGVLPGPLGVPPRVPAVLSALCRRLGDWE